MRLPLLNSGNVLLGASHHPKCPRSAQKHAQTKDLQPETMCRDIPRALKQGLDFRTASGGEQRNRDEILRTIRQKSYTASQKKPMGLRRLKCWITKPMPLEPRCPQPQPHSPKDRRILSSAYPLPPPAAFSNSMQHDSWETQSGPNFVTTLLVFILVYQH